jgi:hypothetical protein
VWPFDDEAPGGPPAGWSVAAGSWTVEAGGTLLQDARSADPVFNVALAPDVSARDLTLTVQVQCVSGEVDQGGGVVWRARGPDDYYIARWNPLEHNLRVYTVEAGRRRQLDTAIVINDPEAPHALRVSMTGDRIRVSLDGEALLDVHDDTFPDAGAVGLWTKADARTRFGDLVVVEGGRG